MSRSKTRSIWGSFIGMRNLALRCLVIGCLAACGLNGQGDFLAAVLDSPDELHAIDPDTFAKTQLATFGFTMEFGGLAYDPNQDLLYLSNGLFSGTPTLYSVDLNTSTVNTLGVMGVSSGMVGLAYDFKQGVLYGTEYSGSQGLYTLDTSTGAATLVGSTGMNLEGLTYNPWDEILVGMVAGDGDLYEIDRSNGSTTLLIDGDYVNSGGLAYDPVNKTYLYGDDNGNVWSYDPADSFARTTNASYFSTHINAMAYVGSAVPEPAETGLFIGCLALGSLAWCRCRKRCGTL